MRSNHFQHFAAATLAAIAISALSACSDRNEADLVAAAKTLLQKNDHAGAIIQLKAALQKNPQSGEARLLLGATLFQSGDASAAVVKLEKAHDLKVDDDQVLPLLARALLETGQAKAVTDRYNQITLKDPKLGAELKATTAAAFGAQGMVDRSEAVVNAALQLDAKNAAARLLKARLKAGSGEFDGALALVSAVLSDVPIHRDAFQLKGELLQLGKGDVEAAIQAFRQALVADPRYMPAHAALLALLLYKLDVEGFKSQYAELKKTLPNHPQTKLIGIQLTLLDKDYKRAREEAQQLLRVAPENALVLQMAGVVEFQNGSLVLAAEHLKKALRNAPNLILSRRLLAETQLRSGMPDKALTTLQPLLSSANPGAEALALAAQAHLQQGDATKAESYYARAAKANPKDPIAHTAMALTQIAKGNADVGLAQLESLASTDASTYADLALINVLIRTKALDAALKAVDKLQVKLPDKALPHELRGRILLQRQDRAGARASFEKALLADPMYFPVVATLAGLDVVDNKPDDARKRFDALLVREPKNYRALLAMAELRQRTGAKPEEVAALLSEAVKSNPDEAAPRLMLIDQHLKLRQATAAREAALSAVAAIPDNLFLLDSLGRAQLATGDTQQAITTFRKAAAVQPNVPQPQLRLADAFVISKDYASAAQSFRRALEISPRLLVAQRGLIKVAQAENRSDEAIKVAKTVQKERPKDAVGYLLESEIHQGQRRWDAAIVAFRAALERERTPEIAMRLHALYIVAGMPSEADKFATTWQKEQPRDEQFAFHLGMLAMARKDYATAESRFRQLLTSHPTDPLVLNNLAMAMLNQGKAGSLPFAERAQQLMPQQAAVMDTLASALVAENQMTKAVEWRRRAVEKSPNDPGLRLELAKLLIKTGDKNGGRAELEKLAKLGTGFSAQSEVAGLLKAL